MHYIAMDKLLHLIRLRHLLITRLVWFFCLCFCLLVCLSLGPLNKVFHNIHSTTTSIRTFHRHAGSWTCSWTLYLYIFPLYMALLIFFFFNLAADKEAKVGDQHSCLLPSTVLILLGREGQKHRSRMVQGLQQQHRICIQHCGVASHAAPAAIHCLCVGMCMESAYPSLLHALHSLVLCSWQRVWTQAASQ